MPLIKNIQSTTIWSAFFLNSISSALILLIALTIHDKFSKYTDNKDDTVIKKKTTLKSIIFTFLFTFLASMIGFTLMYYTFGYGGGLLIPNN
jgi:membrane-anchored protein YejM (alkaline phosphatase superfamily)